MIAAITPSGSMKRELCVDGGLDPSTLHFTLVYIAPVDQLMLKDYAQVTEACLRVASTHAPFEVHLTEIGRFENVRMMTDEKGKVIPATVPTDVVYLKGGGEQLMAFRQALVDYMDEIGCSYSKIHPEFKPHLSLKYIPHGEAFDYPHYLPITFLCEYIEIWTDTDKYRIPLKGSK